MKIAIYFVILLFISNCSFDNKTGIWKSETSISKKDNNVFKEFKKISTETDVFNEIIEFENNKIIQISKPVENFTWSDIYFNDENNLKNFKYTDLNRLIFKSRKLSKGKVNNYLVYDNNNVITTDERGNIIVFSIKENKIISKFNFYKKRYKKFKKRLNIKLKNNIIYTSDNIGYLYAFDYQNDKILWAVNYKIPFKSNLKILDNIIISSDINNNVIFFSKQNGEILKLFPTENTTITNQFINNISKDKNNLIFLNSYGSLYSFDGLNMNLDWFINLSPSLNLNQLNLFYGSKIITAGGKIVVSSNDYTYLIDAKSGTILNKFNFSSSIKPIIINDLAFFVTKNNLLIAININNSKILYSQNINSEVAKYLNSKEKILDFKNMMFLNNDIFLFLKNSFILQFKANGKLSKIKKLPSKINSNPIIIDSSILYLDFKNKLNIVD